MVRRRNRRRRVAIDDGGEAASAGDLHSRIRSLLADGGRRSRDRCMGLRTWDLDRSLRVEADCKRLRQARWSWED